MATTLAAIAVSVLLAATSIFKSVADTTRAGLTKAEVLMAKVTRLERQLDRGEAKNRKLFKRLKNHPHKQIRVCCKTIVHLGKRIQRLKFRVSEHSAFGGVEPVHSGNAHYEDRALDVNAAYGASEYERERLRWLYSELQAIPQISLILYPDNDPAHDDHMHIEW